MNDTSSANANSQELLNKIVADYLREQKRQRFWRALKRIGILLLVLFCVYKFFVIRTNTLDNSSKSHVGLIDVKGTIMADQPGSADNFAKGLAKAYSSKGLKALIIRIDSPGGSPVQADYMYNAIRYYHEKYPAIKTYAVCVDTCASAAYYVAAAADEIYANSASLVGSIGVLYNGFGFVDTMQKVGVTRRLVIAGRNKGFFDPFSPTDPTQEQSLQTMLDLIHQQFIDRVKSGRGARLKINDDTFSGLVWTGAQAKDLGLIDGFASSGQLARDVIKIDQLVDYTNKDNILEQVSKNIGMSLANQLPEAMGLKPGIR
jgi:protease-4